MSPGLYGGVGSAEWGLCAFARRLYQPSTLLALRGNDVQNTGMDYKSLKNTNELFLYGKKQHLKALLYGGLNQCYLCAVVWLSYDRYRHLAKPQRYTGSSKVRSNK